MLNNDYDFAFNTSILLQSVVLELRRTRDQEISFETKLSFYCTDLTCKITRKKKNPFCTNSRCSISRHLWPLPIKSLRYDSTTFYIRRG